MAALDTESASCANKLAEGEERAEARGDDPVALGGEVARQLREQGADALLAGRA